MNQEYIEGRILTCTGGLYTAETSEGLIKCYAKGSFRHDSISPVSGDLVSLRKGTGKQERSYFIIAIHKRSNLLLRPPVANLDRLFLVSSVCDPAPSLLNIDKILSIAVHNRIQPYIVFSKSDLDPQKAKELKRLYEGAGFPVFSLTKLEEEESRKLLLPLVQGFCSAFTGASGVGKSTLINTLFPDLKLTTGEISKKIARGKNTTRQSVLYNVSDYTGVKDSYLADTPGFSQLDFQRFHFLDKEELADTFPEFEKHLGLCRYTKCTHLREDGCMIVENVKNGNISASRHESYCRLYDDLSKFKKWK